MKIHKFKLVALLTLFTTSVAIAYTESPGPRKGVFIKDLWNRIWFLRPGAIAVGKSVAKDADKFLGKPVVFNVTEFDHKYMPNEYRSGSIADDETCGKKSEIIEVSINLRQLNGKQDKNIPALEVRIRNLGKEPFIFRDWGLRIFVFRKEYRKFPAPTWPDDTMLNRLAGIQCKSTDFALPKEEWTKQPNLKFEDTHRLTVPILNYGYLKYQIKDPQELKLTNPDLWLNPGKYQILVTYFGEAQNIRTVSNTIELNIKDKRSQQKSPAKAGQ